MIEDVIETMTTTTTTDVNNLTDDETIVIMTEMIVVKETGMIEEIQLLETETIEGIKLLVTETIEEIELLVMTETTETGEIKTEMMIEMIEDERTETTPVLKMWMHADERGTTTTIKTTIMIR